MIVENAWYVGAWSHEVTPSPLARRLFDFPVVLYRSLDGKACALIDSCAHRGAPLSLGTVVPEGIRCNYHGVVFGCDGICTKIPNQETIPANARVKSFPVVERDDIVWLWHGDPERADPSLIVDYPFHRDPAWPAKFAMAPVAGNYMLIADNLLDATHLAYVHGGTVGGSDPNVHMVAESALKPAPGGLRFERLMRGAPPPPAYSACVPELPERIDRWQEFDFVAPSTVLQYSGGVPAGSERASAPAPRFDMRIFHSATPATESSCYYFWSVQNGHATDDPQATEVIYAQIQQAIAEDKVFIEAQQLRVDELGEDRLFDNAADAARMMARRAVRKYARAHAAPAATEDA
ncbi:Rieske 2Fe-2S domain-containing protein [Erythrobacter arachoides]|uniref:Rieske 2Fe-2S domain-containing protein n=1 Tax=Aurantiacibacter arachoides TaxID=1850444 RepID=A0A844ZZC4_9SPHN|nr:aromatic ring-hydroxylating dioxygenase subunit alpha [Aurantiacibacter arachoides]MXO93631.1 Rieske 2Fe-2S domain-containing protein [Aurantiacibacter arachoides]GGD47910.1 oxidoreductase subunit alpha [Aurantiacibacter arachoides]